MKKYRRTGSVCPSTSAREISRAWQVNCPSPSAWMYAVRASSGVVPGGYSTGSCERSGSGNRSKNVVTSAGVTDPSGTINDTSSALVPMITGT